MGDGMKLVLLPGMDGTGILFEPLLQRLGDLDVEVIELPNSGPQDYDSLARYTATRIGGRDCVVLAESFSGGIAEALLNDRSLNIKHVVFVASFLSSPSRLLSRVVSLLPVRALAAIPVFAPLVMRALLFGRTAPPDAIALFRKAISIVPPRILRARLLHMASYRCSRCAFNTEATYLKPTRDFLVSDREVEFGNAFPRLNVVEVEGPHFILQAEPDACAKYVLAAVGHLTCKGSEAPTVPLL